MGMFERFTGQARRVLFLAHQEAQRLGHDHVGTDHLLLGVLREGSGAVARLLAGLGVDAGALRRAAESKAGAALDTPPWRQLPLTPSARRALERALAEADRLHRRAAGPEHLLLGLLHEGDGEAAQTLVTLDLDLDAVRAQLLQQPPEEDRDVMVQAERRPGAAPAPLSDPSAGDLEALFAAAVVPGDVTTGGAAGRRRVSNVPLRVDRGDVALQLRLTQLMLGALAGAVAGAMMGIRHGALLGLVAGLALAAVRIRPLSGFVGALAGILAAAQHFGDLWWAPALGAVVGALIGACLGQPAGYWPEPQPEEAEEPDEEEAAEAPK